MFTGKTGLRRVSDPSAAAGHCTRLDIRLLCVWQRLWWGFHKAACNSKKKRDMSKSKRRRNLERKLHKYILCRSKTYEDLHPYRLRKSIDSIPSQTEIISTYHKEHQLNTTYNHWWLPIDQSTTLIDFSFCVLLSKIICILYITGFLIKKLVKFGYACL